MHDEIRDVRVELLAPAGGIEALRAAVNNGADAVYLGLHEFNARRGAENFSLDGLIEAVRYAHLRGVRVYLTANVLLRDGEIRRAVDLAVSAWGAGVDAIIVQDLGYAKALKAAIPDVRLHASTQIGTHESATVAELVRMGFSRVTLAREVRMADIRTVTLHSEIEVEVFAHGALCVSYSGQCLLSSAVGGRSANRGSCAQPCRLPYELLDQQGVARPAPGRYLLSPRDLCAAEILPGLVGAGVAAIKLEGRLKRPEYVAVVTRVYRAVLDRVLADPEHFSLSAAEFDALGEVFNRGFTIGHAGGARGSELMGFERPNNRGTLVGRVASTAGGRVAIDLEKALERGDVIEFWTARGRSVTRLQEMVVRGSNVPTAPAGSRVFVPYERTVRAGDRVFRVASASLEAAARRTFDAADAGRIVPVRINVRARLGSPLNTTVTARGVTVEAQGPIVEPARTKVLEAYEVEEHVGRLGGTPFRPEKWEIEVDPGVGMGFSVLHAARREAVAALEEALLAPWSERLAAVAVPEPVRAQPKRSRSSRRAGGSVESSEMPFIDVWTTRLAIARACLDAGAHRVIVPLWALRCDDQIPERVWIETPRVVHEHELETVRSRATAGPPIVATTPGLLGLASESHTPSWAHWGLNATNVMAVDALVDAGAVGVWLSPELSGADIAGIAREVDVPVGISVLGRQELMVLEHCVISSTRTCSRTCGTCRARLGWYSLKDRKGFSMPVLVDPSGRTHVFNAVPLDLTRAMPEIVSSQVAAVRLDMTVESIQTAQRGTRFVREALELAIAGRDVHVRSIYERSTTGHYYRGTK